MQEQVTMRNIIIVLLAVFVIGITALSVYLTPDDLARCQMVASSKKNCLKADAILAVSGGNTSVRTAEAVRLYQEGWADTLVFSGAAKDTSGPSNAEVMRRQAVSEGVAADDIIIETLAQTTKENAEKTKQLLISRGIKRVILVTSAYHQRRASLEFQSLAGDGITIVNHPAPNDPDWPKLWWLTPRGWWLVGGETVKIIAFHVGGSR